MKDNKTLKRLFLLTCICIPGALASCAYTETMNQREAEGQQLQRQLGYEIERGRQLTR